MYIQGKSKEKLDIRLNSARSNTVLILGMILFVSALAILFFGLGIAGGNIRISGIYYISSEARSKVFTTILIIFLAVGLEGAGHIYNAVAMKSVKFIIYEEGIYGTSMKLNPLLGLLTKTQNFDMSFADITGFRYEQGLLLLQSRYGEHSFGFAKEDVNRIMELLKQEVS